ncbi:MAG: HAD family hydrolase [Oscillospiraceae bacterium]|nr:HAD family hydrolase [Oscillospiraceae bacterium]
MKYELAIFDLDGTILNTLDDLADSLNHVLAEHGFPQHTADEVRMMVGNGILNLIKRALPDNAEQAVVETVYNDFNKYYKLHSADKTKPYEGIIEMLEQLKSSGVKLAVVSNKADYAVQDLCVKYFGRIFDAVAGEKTGVPKKPAPDAVNNILAQLGIERKKSVYIGDSDVDLQTAENSEMDCIAVNWGFRDEKLLRENGAELIVSSPSEIVKIITID